jgi:multidrug efflux pump subunit AcrA (membrane-fusion protein)
MIVSLDAGATSRSEAVAVVPLNAIVRSADDSVQFAVVVVNDGVARRKPVTLGNTYGDRIAVTGINAGERVVSSGASFVDNGDAVKVIP